MRQIGQTLQRSVPCVLSVPMRDDVRSDAVNPVGKRADRERFVDFGGIAKGVASVSRSCAVASDERVGAAVPVDGVAARTANHDVVAAAAEERVVPVAAVDRVGA